MKTIETTGKISKRGILKLDKQIRGKTDKKVKVIIFLTENSDIDEKLWLKSIANNPAFYFLNDKEEDLYSIKDGKPFKT